MEFAIVFLLVVGFILFTLIKIIPEYERTVMYSMGKYATVEGPGLVFNIPLLYYIEQRVDIRIRTEDIPPQDVISKDNVSVKVNAVVYYRVVDPEHAINNVEDFRDATSQLAQTTLRSVLGKHELDDMLSNREQLNADVQEILDSHINKWGIKITNVEIKNVDIDPTMVRAIAKQAEAERSRRARVINAEGEFQAAKQLDAAAEILARRPETMQLRYLDTLGQFTNSKGSTIVLPMPMDLLASVAKIAGTGQIKK
ncbi:MAG: slipin family protein [Alphaproteobacteria bacterium]|nr:slipin family protein [Alphaproteobacteria bacterium]